jgi:DNA (cytosine-5)-methyltransferase 1
MSLSSTNGYNDYFLFNDLRNGKTTIHSWDICDTSERQRDICLLMLKNRRKSQYGPLDGNPLSLAQFQKLDATITQSEILGLVELSILKEVDYRFEVLEPDGLELSEEERTLLEFARDGEIVIDRLKIDRVFRVKRIPILKTIMSLAEKSAVRCVERRYEFKNGKISSGLNGVNRIFMPSSDLFPTLVASDTNDFVALHDISPSDHEDYKRQFISKVFSTGAYRKITKEEACVIQGFPSEFRLPKSRARWMKLIGNSVSVPVISGIARSILETGVFDEEVILSVGSSHECEEAGAPL